MSTHADTEFFIKQHVVRHEAQQAKEAEEKAARQKRDGSQPQQAQGGRSETVTPPQHS